LERDALSDFRVSPRIFYISGIALLIGVAGALIAFALMFMIGFFTNLFYYHRLVFTFVSPYPNQLGGTVIAIPVIGALMIGLMARYGAEKIRGHGIPEAMEAILGGKSMISPKVALLKPLSAAISIGSGGPFGAEGPIIMSGGSFGSVVGQLLHVTAAERKTLLLCGAAAGMSATFHSPIAAVLFSVELLAFELRLRSLVPIALASGIADFTRSLIAGNQPMFPSSAAPDSPNVIVLVAVLFGIVGALLAYALTKAIYGVEGLFEKLPLHWMWWPAIGGLAIGLGGFWVPRVLGVGYDTIGQLVEGKLLIEAVLIFLLVKMAVWVIALGSGTSGGILAPLLIIGGTLGNGLAQMLHIHQPGVWSILGMAALFSGVTRSPLTTMVFLLELTHDVSMVFPTLITCAVAAAVSAVILPRSILTEKIARRGRHIARDYLVHPLDLQRVSHFMTAQPVSFPAEQTLAAAYTGMKREPETYRFTQYPVLSANGGLVGMIDAQTIAQFGVLEQSQHRTIGDVARKGISVPHYATMLSAMQKMLEWNTDRLVVLNEQTKPVGLITKHSILLAGKLQVEEETQRERFIRFSGKSKQTARSSSQHGRKHLMELAARNQKKEPGPMAQVLSCCISIDPMI